MRLHVPTCSKTCAKAVAALQERAADSRSSVGETSLTCVLLIAAGLMLHSFVNLLNADPGFRPQHVLTATISLPRAQYQSDVKRIAFFQGFNANLKSLPGVQTAGVGTDLPWTGYDENADGYWVERADGSRNDKTMARYHAVSPDYFRTPGSSAPAWAVL